MKKREERSGIMERDGNDEVCLFGLTFSFCRDGFFADGNDRPVKKAKLDG